MNRSVCYHEAAHAVIAAQFGFSVRCLKVHQAATETGELGRCEIVDMRTVLDIDPTRACIYILAGAAGERRWTGRPSTSDSLDREGVSVIASCILELPEDSPRVRGLVASSAAIADAMMLDPDTWRAVQTVATALEQKRFLSGRDLQLIVRKVWR